MKTKLILLCFALFIGCSSKQPNNSVNALDKKFTEFLNKFDSLKLPFNIISFDDIGEYIRDTTFEGIPNPHLKPIAGSELIFLKGKYIMDQTNQYSSIYKKQINHNLLLIIKQKCRIKEEHWIKLNLFSLNGVLQDTLTFAGQKVGYYNKYGKISSNLHITTFSYHDIKEDTANLDNYYATEIYNEYSISNEGKFSLVKTKKERGYFTNYGKENIVARVDTLQR